MSVESVKLERGPQTGGLVPSGRLCFEVSCWQKLQLFL